MVGRFGGTAAFIKLKLFNDFQRSEEVPKPKRTAEWAGYQK